MCSAHGHQDAKKNPTGRKETNGIHATHPGTAVPGSPDRHFRSSGFPARALPSAYPALNLPPPDSKIAHNLTVAPSTQTLPGAKV